MPINYNDLFQIEISDPVKLERVTQAFDQIYSTSEGQFLLQQMTNIHGHQGKILVTEGGVDSSSKFGPGIQSLGYGVNS